MKALIVFFGLAVACGLSTRDAIGACADHTCTVNGQAYQCDDFCTGSNCTDGKTLGTCNVCNPGGADTSKCTLCIYGTGSNTVYGTSSDDVICIVDSTSTFWVSGSGGGVDTIFAKGGNDIIATGGGNDVITPDAGNDTVWAGDGNDQVNASAGGDTIHGEGGNDNLKGGDDSDTIYGDAGLDDIDGGNAVDTIDGGADDDSILGGAGDDVISTGTGNNTVDGGANDDIVYGDVGNDTLRGGTGDDLIIGAGGRDSLKGDDGDDDVYTVDISHTPADSVVGSLLCGGAGDDVLVGWGPGHQCLDAGADQVGAGRGSVNLFGTPTTYDCWYALVATGSPSSQDHDVGTTRNCADRIGGNPTGTFFDATSPCGCD